MAPVLILWQGENSDVNWLKELFSHLRSLHQVESYQASISSDSFSTSQMETETTFQEPAMVEETTKTSTTLSVSWVAPDDDSVMFHWIQYREVCCLVCCLFCWWDSYAVLPHLIMLVLSSLQKYVTSVIVWDRFRIIVPFFNVCLFFDLTSRFINIFEI